MLGAQRVGRCTGGSPRTYSRRRQAVSRISDTAVRRARFDKVTAVIGDHQPAEAAPALAQTVGIVVR
ncbi:hypothetical protein [Actinoplanes sp. NPDC023714]|uniref:hypothetical protein n=1 Tax=Actinoplanes sp. NPDC023714 TaxID=3154322 RepID=UPI00340CBA71